MATVTERRFPYGNYVDLCAPSLPRMQRNSASQYDETLATNRWRYTCRALLSGTNPPKHTLLADDCILDRDVVWTCRLVFNFTFSGWFICRIQ
jgi:hypothetical protein